MTQEDKKKVVNDWLTNNYKQLEINSKKLAQENNPLRPDLLAHTLEQFLTKDLDIQYRIVSEEKPEFYITRMMALNLKSSTSSFYTKYRKPALSIREFHVNKKYDGQQHDYELEDNLEGDLFTDIPEDVKLIRKTMKMLKEDNFYYHDLINKLYIQGWDHTSYAEYYGIPITELRNNVTQARQKFKRIYKLLQYGIIE